MNKFTKLLFGALLVVGAAATARHARAEGVVLTPAALDPASRASLKPKLRAHEPATPPCSERLALSTLSAVRA
ncbi:MAG: hypothetical protein IPI67_23910 [Myxococcales bacterium]|nr:hypothetical protein [Myxococcales bacterium]